MSRHEICRQPKHLQEKTDGCGGWYALKRQYAGKDKWDAEVKRTTAILHSRKWKGNSTHSLDLFVSLHRTVFVAMQASAKHVGYQILNEHSRVRFLLDGIKCEDVALQTVIATLEEDDAPF